MEENAIQEVKKIDPCAGCTNPYDACPEPDDHGHCRYERGYKDPYASEIAEQREEYLYI